MAAHKIKKELLISIPSNFFLHFYLLSPNAYFSLNNVVIKNKLSSYQGIVVVYLYVVYILMFLFIYLKKMFVLINYFMKLYLIIMYHCFSKLKKIKEKLGDA